MNKEITVFQTGRQYSDKGQRIAVCELSDSRVMFADVDRNIDGVTTIVRHRGDSVQEHVMWCYDRGHYTSGFYEFGIPHDTLEDRMNLMSELRKAAKAL